MSEAEVQELILPDGFSMDDLYEWGVWATKHVGDVDDLIAAASEWASVPAIPIRPKWTVTKTAGDTFVAVIEDAPPFVESMTTGTTREQLVAEVIKWGPAAYRLFKALPEIRRFIKEVFGV